MEEGTLVLQRAKEGNVEFIKNVLERGGVQSNSKIVDNIIRLARRALRRGELSSGLLIFIGNVIEKHPNLDLDQDGGAPFMPLFSAVDEGNNNVLHLAARDGNLAAVKFLVDLYLEYEFVDCPEQASREWTPPQEEEQRLSVYSDRAPLDFPDQVNMEWAPSPEEEQSQSDDFDGLNITVPILTDQVNREWPRPLMDEQSLSVYSDGSNNTDPFLPQHVNREWAPQEEEQSPSVYSEGSNITVPILSDQINREWAPLEEQWLSVRSEASCVEILEDEELEPAPWLMPNERGELPIDLALNEKGTQAEICANLIFRQAESQFCERVYDDGHTLLCQAIQNKFPRLACYMLLSGIRPHVGCTIEFTVLNFLLTQGVTPGECCKLLEKRPEIIKDQNNPRRRSPFHEWAANGDQQALESILNEFRHPYVVEAIRLTDVEGATPLHVAFKFQKTQFAMKLCRLYREASLRRPPNESHPDSSLWEIQDDNGSTPLHLALANELSQEEQNGDDPLLRMMNNEVLDVLKIRNNAGESPLFIAVQHGHGQIVRKILESQQYIDLINMVIRHDGTTVLHIMIPCQEEVGKLLVEKFPWLINSRDKSNNKTPFQAAEEAGVEWAKILLSAHERNNDDQVNFDWIEAAKRGYSSPLIAFILQCPRFLKTCSELKQTPLHYIKFNSLEEYKKFLSLPIISKMKNMPDQDGATPLHRALERRDMLLAEALLTSPGGVNMRLQDKNNRTALYSLAKLCEQDQQWKEMSERAKIYLGGRPMYLRGLNKDLSEIRRTLSVVAALLTTLTFAAGYTIPGGFDNKSGDAISGKKRVTFIVFLLADSIAMCCAMLALFCLIWSMLCDNLEKSEKLVDGSVVVLMVALYGTLIAFAAGVFTIAYRHSLWATIVVCAVCVVCIAVGILATKTVLNKLIHDENAEHRDTAYQVSPTRGENLV